MPVQCRCAAHSGGEPSRCELRERVGEVRAHPIGLAHPCSGEHELPERKLAEQVESSSQEAFAGPRHAVTSAAGSW